MESVGHWLESKRLSQQRDCALTVATKEHKHTHTHVASTHTRLSDTRGWFIYSTRAAFSHWRAPYWPVTWCNKPRHHLCVPWSCGTLSWMTIQNSTRATAFSHVSCWNNDPWQITFITVKLSTISTSMYQLDRNTQPLYSVPTELQYHIMPL